LLLTVVCLFFNQWWWRRHLWHMCVDGCRPTKLTATSGASCARSWFTPTTAPKNCCHGSMALTSAFVLSSWILLDVLCIFDHGPRRPWLAMYFIFWNSERGLCLRSEACWRLTRHTSKSMESRYSLPTCWMIYSLKRDFPKLDDFRFPPLKRHEMGETRPHVQSKK
jgi:hypothetical protein